MDHFPLGWDYAWLATDAIGQIGIFTNAGEGPVPTVVLASRNLADQAEELVRRLPARGRADLLTSLPRPEDFVAFADRGLFAYDWQDAHRTTSNRLNRYELVALPVTPLTILEMTPEIQELAPLVRFVSLRFSECPYIVVPEHVEC